MVAGAGVTGLAGCFGSDDGDTDDGEGQEDDSSDETSDDNGDQPDPTDELTDEEIAEEVSDDFAALLADGDVEQYNQVLHSDGKLDPVESENESFFGPDITVVESTVTEREEEQIIVEITVEIEQLEETFETTWELDIRRDDDIEWGLWDIETDDLLSEPALSPEGVVEEFVQALNAGDTETVTSLLAEDGNAPETIRTQPEEFEGIVELVETSVSERKDGQARIDTTVVYDSPDGEIEDEWELIVAVVNGNWELGWVR